MTRTLPKPSDLSDRWALDPTVVFLNHGSFGAAPRVVLGQQDRVRSRLEAEPVRFFDRQYLERLDAARRELATFVGGDAEGLVFVDNATTGVNTVLRSLSLESRDELLTTDHEYNACRNALEAVAAAAGASVVVAAVPFPTAGEDEVLDAVLGRITPRTRLLLVDHVTSQTGLVMPIRRIVQEAHGRGVEVLVDGAHAPGMVELDLEAIGADSYVGNCHKWICAPKGAAFLSVRRDRRRAVRPLVISHGANAPDGKRSRYRLEHDWTGTRDPSPWLCVPSAIREMAAMVDGGWPEIRRRNRELALEARRLLCSALDFEPPCPEAMVGSMASLPLPSGRGAVSHQLFPFDALQDELYHRFSIEVPVIAWPRRPHRLLRVSAQLYNCREQYEYLASSLKDCLERGA